MNRLPGRIRLVETSGDISLVEVEVDVDGAVMTSLVLETPETALHLAPGQAVSVLFKETEVILASSDPGTLSVRNRLPCRVLGREAGRLLTHFRLDWRGRVLHALITTRSAEALGLADGAEAVALVKSTEVALEGTGP